MAVLRSRHQALWPAGRFGLLTAAEPGTCGLQEWHSNNITAASVVSCCYCYCIIQISTRRFGKSGGSWLIPVAEFANHQSNCRHFLHMENCTVTPALKQWTATLPARTQNTPLAATAIAEATPASGATPAPAPACDRCGLAAAATQSGGTEGGSDSGDSSSSGQCIVWRAGEAVSAGQQLCYSYKQMMLQDYALLQYGFLQVSWGWSNRHLECVRVQHDFMP